MVAVTVGHLAEMSWDVETVRVEAVDVVVEVAEDQSCVHELGPVSGVGCFQPCSECLQ